MYPLHQTPNGTYTARMPSDTKIKVPSAGLLHSYLLSETPTPAKYAANVKTAVTMLTASSNKENENIVTPPPRSSSLPQNSMRVEKDKQFQSDMEYLEKEAPNLENFYDFLLQRGYIESHPFSVIESSNEENRNIVRAPPRSSSLRQIVFGLI